MKFFKKQKDDKLMLAVFGENQVSDWKILWRTTFIILILSIVLGFYIYNHIGKQISRDPSYFYVENQSIDAEKVDKIILEIESRKSNFEELSNN